MQSNRKARLQSVIQQELSLVLPREIKEPRVVPITITSVEISPDGSHAKVFVTPLGGLLSLPDPSPEAHEKRMRECLQGLASASGFLRRHLARVLAVKNVPNLVFQEDMTLDNTIRVQHLLRGLTESGKGPLPDESD